MRSPRLMMRRPPRSIATAGWLVMLAAVSVGTQAPPLTVVSADPVGPLQLLADARQIRVRFSEPMVPLGAPPLASAPPWVRVTPDTPGAFYWSGTRTLVFAPDPARALPYATPFTIRIDGSATSAAGRRLDTPYTFTFTTPYVHLVEVRHRRIPADVTKPVLLMLEFNAAVRPEEVLRHVQVAFEPHDWNAPAFSPEARQYLAEHEPAGLALFEQKVAAVRRVASSRERLDIRLADVARLEDFLSSYDRERNGHRFVVLETTTPPPPGSWLRVTIDERLPSVTPREAGRTAVQKLEPAFFVLAPSCTGGCDPAWPASPTFSLRVEPEQLRSALSLTDLTNPGVESVLTGQEMRDSGGRLQWPSGLDQTWGMRRWRLQVKPDVRSSDGQLLGYPWVGFTDTVHASAVLELGGWVVEAGRPPLVPVIARNVTALTQWMRRVPESTLASTYAGIDVFRLARAPVPTAPANPEVRRLPGIVDRTAVHPLDLREILSGQDTGLIHMSVAGRDVVGPGLPAPAAFGHLRTALIQVTNLGITVKSAAAGSLAFVTRLDTGVAVAGARVSVIDAKDRVRWQGLTGQDGVVRIPASARLDATTDTHPLFVTARKDGDVAFVSANWRDTTRSLFEILGTLGQPEAEETAGNLNASVFTERSVYRQSDVVHVKALFRRTTATGLRLLPAEATMTAVMSGPDGEVARRTLRLNRWSSAEWSWPVPADAALGTYTLRVHSSSVVRDANALGSAWFEVAAVRLPGARVDVTLTSNDSGNAVELEGHVSAQFLAGDSLGPRPFFWRMSHQSVMSPPAAVRERFPEERWTVGYAPYAGSDSPSGNTTLDASGRAGLRQAARSDVDYAIEYTLHADVDVLGGQHLAAKASTTVHPSLYLPLARPKGFVDAKDGFTTAVAVVDLDGRPVTGVPVTVSLFLERTVASGEPVPGELYFPTRQEEAPSGTWTVSSDLTPTSLTVPLPAGGAYIVRASARDRNGRSTRTELRFHASGARSDVRADESVELVSAQEVWAPGDRARLQLRSPWSAATALLTTERNGIRTYRTFAVTSNAQVIEVPIARADAPTLRVSVVLIKGRTAQDLARDGSDPGRPDYRLARADLRIEDPDQQLRVQVSSDQREYQPGTRARVDVQVTRASGLPASGEVTMWAVDEGLLALKRTPLPYPADDLLQSRSPDVVTSDSRMRLLATRVQAQAAGDGDIAALTVALAANTSVDVMNLHQTVSLLSAPPTIRTNFQPVVFWLGSVPVDANGRASTTVTLPDSLTSYRIRAVATSGASRFGTGEAGMRVTKPLTLRPSFPRFLNGGDEASLAVIIGSPVTGDVDVTLELPDGPLVATGATTRRVPVTAGIAQTVAFGVRAQSEGVAHVRVRATGAGGTDAFELPLKVIVPTVVTTTAAFGDTTGTAQEQLTVAPGGRRSGLQLELSSTVLHGLNIAAQSLYEYPHECAEQQTSRALALLMVARSGGAVSVPGMTVRGAREKAAALLRGLRTHQCDYGGFTLWGGGECNSASTYLTAYVLHVMRVGGSATAALSEDRLTEALDYLAETGIEPPTHLHEWSSWAASRAAAARTLADFGRSPADDIQRLLPALDRLPVVAMSHLADALAASGDRSARYQTVVRALLNSLRVNGDEAYVEERDPDELAYIWQSNVGATAVVLEGLVRRRDPNVVAASLARWLMSVRSAGHWASTHEDALALESLATFYRHLEGGGSTMRAVVRSGPATLTDVALGGAAPHARAATVPIASLLLPSEATVPLTITRTGTGRLYYSARLRTSVAMPRDAEDRGIAVERTYERYGDAASTRTGPFTVGEVVRVTVTATLRAEGRYVALTDWLPAGFEAIDEQFDTTSDLLAGDATTSEYIAPGDERVFTTAYGFNHVEKRDERVLAFATTLAPGQHRFSYLVRVTSAGTFTAPGASTELMYLPDVSGRSAATTVTIR